MLTYPQPKEKLVKRTVAIVLATITMALGLTSCATGGSPSNDSGAGGSSGSLYERTITLTDGRDVTCVIYHAGYGGGLSCDWAHTKAN